LVPTLPPLLGEQAGLAFGSMQRHRVLDSAGTLGARPEFTEPGFLPGGFRL
jgi:hypothetical protein